MLQRTSALLALFLVVNVAHASSSIYGAEFDYKNAKPTSQFFSGKTREQIASYCKNEILGTRDLSECAQFRYEMVIDSLNRRVSSVEKIIEDSDKRNEVYGQPAALPFFKRSQAYWEQYRDNYCYSDVYSVGQASLRFVDFWDCMARITKNRLDELTEPNDDE